MRAPLTMTWLPILLLLAMATGPGLVAAQDDDLEPVPLVPFPFNDIDLNGTWNYRISQPTVSGHCPAGNPVAGTAVITQKGTEVTLKYTSGVRCDPVAVCSYSGTLSDEQPAKLIVSNSVGVDDEGGTASGAIALSVLSNEFADGKGTNEYVHPEGFECRWNMHVTFTRELDEDDE